MAHNTLRQFWNDMSDVVVDFFDRNGKPVDDMDYPIDTRILKDHEIEHGVHHVTLDVDSGERIVPVKQSDLERIYHILDVFSAYFVKEIPEKTDCVYMTEDFLNLNAAKGMIGAMLPESKEFERLLIQKPETRNRITEGYMSASILFDQFLNKKLWNMPAESCDAFSETVLELMSILHFLLNLTVASDPADTQAALEQVLGLCDKSDQLLDELRSLDPDDPEVIERCIDLEDLFKLLRPMGPSEKLNIPKGGSEGNG